MELKSFLGHHSQFKAGKMSTCLENPGVCLEHVIFLSPRLDLLDSNCDFKASAASSHGLGWRPRADVLSFGTRFNIFWLIKEKLGQS